MEKEIDYYSNGKIQYDGEYVNNKYELYGKYIWESGECYIREWQNGLFYGKGIYYYSNGKIQYNGYWINDKFVGN